MGLPKIDFDIGHTVGEFLTTLRDISAKLDTLIELQRDAASPEVCVECEGGGRLRCSVHGPVRVPPIDQREGWQRGGS